MAATLLSLKGPVGLLVFLVVMGAGLTQMQVRGIVPALFKVRRTTLLAGHRWLGRAALAGFVLDSVFCVILALSWGFPVTPRYLLHSLFGVLGAAVFLGKVWIVRRRVRWGMARVMLWGAGLAVLQTGIFLTGTLFALAGLP